MREQKRDWVPIGISIGALIVAVVGAVVSIVIASTAREQAEAARSALKNTLDQQSLSLARKIAITPNTSSLMISKTGALPVRFVSGYLTNADGSLSAQLAFSDPLKGCTAINYSTGDTDTNELAVTFIYANNVNWLIPPNGAVRKAPDTTCLANDDRDWKTATTAVTTCF